MRVLIILIIMLAVIYLIIKYDEYQHAVNKKTKDLPNKDAYSINKPLEKAIIQLDIEQEWASPPNKAINAAQWTLELLLALEWKRYELLCKEWLIVNGYNARLTTIGADGGIDIKISNAQRKMIAIAQCKAWRQKINVNLIREFYGVMTSEHVTKGYFFTTSDFTADALHFSRGKNIELITGEYLLKQILLLDANKQQYLYQLATEGDYSTPTCPSCNIKMIKRSSEKGEFWGCQNYPRCKTILHLRQ
jgi:restriction system protein